MATNLTEFEDPFLDLEDEEYSLFENILDIWDIVITVTQMVVDAFSIGACIFLIFTFLKFSRLRTRLTRYFLHYAIATLLMYICKPTYDLISWILRTQRIFTGYTGFCVAFQADLTLTCVSYVFATAPVVHWYLLRYKNESFSKHPNLQGRFVILTYAFGVTMYIVCASTCGLHYSSFRRYVFISLYILCLLTVLTFNWMYRKNRGNEAEGKTKYVFTIGTFIIMAWSPVAVGHFITFVIHTLNDSRIIRTTFAITYEIPAIFANSLPCIVVILLGRLSKKFQMAFDQIFKRSRRDYIDDDFESSDDEVQSANITEL